MSTHEIDYVITEADNMIVDIDPNLDPKEKEEIARAEIADAMFVHQDNLTIVGIKEVD